LIKDFLHEFAHIFGHVNFPVPFLVHCKFVIAVSRIFYASFRLD